jgi:hypothetical protein
MVAEPVAIVVAAVNAADDDEVPPPWPASAPGT